MKLGSLFDGIGGFPLAASRYGIIPVWASEIEPFPVKVTQKHFPGMKHLGDITQINGGEIEPVDIITFGSPCQDLSIAGKREGLSGERSGLFSHAVRIIREMRAATDGKFPRFAVWENVPGAFSSNKGQDFRAVLEEIAEAEIPMPTSGKWAEAGMVRTERIDIAWRTLDAQYWGVPQRRKRIFLVADFTGQCAGEILFKRQGLRGHSAESREAREGIAADAERGVGTAVCYPINTQIITRHNKLGRNTGFGLGKEGDPAYTLQAGHEHGVVAPIAIDSNCQDSRFKLTGQVVPTIPAKVGTGGNNGPMLAIPINNKTTRHKGGGESRKNDGSGNGLGVGKPGDVMPTLGTGDSHAVAYGIDQQGGKGQANYGVDVMPPLCSDSHGTPHAVAYNAVATMDCQNLCENKELSGTLQSKDNGGYSLNYQNPVRIGYAVRRLTPLECERLQGFPDNWTNIPGASDTARYKAIGNSVAIPCVQFIMRRIKEVIGSTER